VLLRIAALPLSEQLENLDKTMSSWKRNVEQIDDITVIGIKV
jgi:hypothetical protein